MELSANHHQNNARNAWLFSYYLAGMRVSDVLKIKWGEIRDGRIHYQMNKNKKNASFIISEKLSRIIDQYTKHESALHKYIFPELNGINQENDFIIFRKTKNATEKFNGHLKKVAFKAGITKKLTMHIARHSFGNIAGDTIHPLMLQKLYRHSNLGTTINYQGNFIPQETDEALLAVINS